MHAVGPISLAERTLLRGVADGVVVYSRATGDHVLAMREDGTCVFLGEDGCAIHTPLGGRLKPAACRHFPLGLTATPTGWRATLEAKCPCATLGERPELTEETVREGLADRAGRLRPDFEIAHVTLRPGKTIDFEAYEALERDWLMRLEQGEDPASVLDRLPLAGRPHAHWAQLGRSYLSDPGHTRFHIAVRWMGAALVRLAGGEQAFEESRPWAAAFDRAEARASVPSDPGDVERTWIAESLWSLKWARRGSLEVARWELATRLAAARDIRAHLVAEGLRPDRAAAEAVMIADLVGDAPGWDDVVEALDVR